MPLLTGTAAGAAYRQQVALAHRIRQLPHGVSTTLQHIEPPPAAVDRGTDHGQSGRQVELP